MMDSDRPRTSKLQFTREETQPQETADTASKQKKLMQKRKPAQMESKSVPDSDLTADGKLHSLFAEPVTKSGSKPELRLPTKEDWAHMEKIRKHLFKDTEEMRRFLSQDVFEYDGTIIIDPESDQATAVQTLQDMGIPAEEKPPPKAGKPSAASMAEKATEKTTGKTRKAGAAESAKTEAQKAAPRLKFEENKKKPTSKLKHPSTVVRTVNTELHRNIAEANEDNNVAVNASLMAEQKTESALKMGDHAFHAHKLRAYRKAEEKVDKANIRMLQQAKEAENPTFTSNPYSRWQQKRAIRREYAKAKANKSVIGTHGSTGKARETASGVKDRLKQIVSTVKKRPKVLLLGMLGGMMVLVMSVVQSCTPLAQSILESIVIGTYPASEDDVRAAESVYASKERELKYEMDHYEEMHPGYDEYNVTQDEIWHNPYVLIAIISAYYDGQDWDIDSAMPVIEKYFDLQYRVTEEVVTETRYRTEEQTGTRWVTDPDTGESTLETYTYNADVPYEYTICNVDLENYDLSHTPVISMSHHTMGMYALYMATHGNMEGIFSGNPYAVPLKDPYIYEIPQETLDADPNFAKLMEEANKYVGYPYVWGGASPETSFDCSGFVSYVYTASGVYNIGRRGANGLHSMCRTVSEEEVRPGDLVFFAGTMGDDVGGITHVGIYVGNHHMIHCGSPCGYADLNDYYWVQHFHSYGRVPY